MRSTIMSVIIASVVTCSASGQVKDPRRQPPAPVTPAPTKPSTQTPPPATVVLPEPVDPGPYVTRERSKEWLATIAVGLRAGRYDDPDPENSALPDTRPFDFKTLSTVFPIAPATAGSIPLDGSIKGKLTINDSVASEVTTLLRNRAGGLPYPGGIRLVRMDAMDGRARSMRMELEYRVRLFETKFDEAAAKAVAWPTGPWPAIAQSTFEPQMFLDYAVIIVGNGAARQDFDPAPLKAMVDEWTGGNPKSQPPVVLAKWITSKVWELAQVSGEGNAFHRTGEFKGFQVQGSAETLRLGRGSGYDVAALLVSAFRQAGLPARLIIGFDKGERGAGDNILSSKRSNPSGLRAWAEFCLYDEAKNTINWVPVDIVRLRKSSSRPRSIDQTWKYFGTHDELSAVVPLAFQFHPPTTVEAFGAPGLWGWLITPETPDLRFYQAITFRLETASQRGGTPNRSGGN